MPMRVYYDRDADVNLIKGKNVAVVGYGSQGHAHALNLKDSGVKDVRVALRAGSATAKKAENAGLKVMTPADAAKWADLVMVLTPDQEAGRGARFRARPQHPLQADRAARRSRRADGGAEGSRPYRARRVPER